MLLCDVDDLREVNNTFDHLDGDAALAAVAAAFRAELRPYDLCARFGGDEFLVVLPETGEEEAVSVAGRIQDWLVGHRLPTREGGMLAVSVSLGVGSLREGDPELGSMIARADAAMYEEKRTGTRSFLAVA